MLFLRQAGHNPGCLVDSALRLVNIWWRERARLDPDYSSNCCGFNGPALTYQAGSRLLSGLWGLFFRSTLEPAILWHLDRTVDPDLMGPQRGCPGPALQQAAFFGAKSICINDLNPFSGATGFTEGFCCTSQPSHLLTLSPVPEEGLAEADPPLRYLARSLMS